MGIRESIREYLDNSDGPKWGSEIIAAVRAAGFKCKPSIVTAMASDGLLVKHEKAGQPIGYTVGARPRAARSEEERAAARKESERKRAAARNELRMAQRRARGVPSRADRKSKLVLATSHATVGGESVAEFLARGGQIERLPGFQRDNVFPQRRPVWAASNRQVSV